MLTKQGDREINEDSAVIAERDNNYCFVVADGLGGHSRGEAASQMVTAVFEREFTSTETSASGFLSSTFNSAQNAVMALQKTEQAQRGMKTTAAALAIIEGKCAWGHIGDSRLYVFKNGRVKSRTLDHSVPQMLALSGEISEKKIRRHPDRNKLLRVIGIEWDSQQFEVSDEYEVSECQAFLLCSDGFWEFIREKHMCRYLKKSNNAGEWLRLMTEEVERNGAERNMDNYSAITVIL